MSNHHLQQIPYNIEHSSVGMVQATDVPLLVELLVGDLTNERLAVEDVLGAYRRWVDDVARVERASQVLQDAFDGRLKTEDDFTRLKEVLYFAGRQQLLAKYSLGFPAYNVLQDYFANAVAPVGPSVTPRPRVEGRSWALLGKRIGFPIGVPASVLTANARWVQYFAANGFNVLTYKTVRSRAHGPLPPPNWAFVSELSTPLPLDSRDHIVRAQRSDWVDAGSRGVSTTNSFGVPSSAPAEWQSDLETALQTMLEDQLLLVSVMGADYESKGTVQALADDFRQVALLAEMAGARHIELNLSCPNTVDAGGGGVLTPLCHDVTNTLAVVQAVRDSLDGGTSLVAKLSYLPQSTLEPLVHGLAPLVEGIAGINTLQCSVTDGRGPLFPGREKAGVSGIAIRDHASDFVGRLARLRVESGRWFDILAMGGVTDAASFDALYQYGASSVQSASGVFANPFLAADCVAELGQKLPARTSGLAEDEEAELQYTLLAAVEQSAHGHWIDPLLLAPVFPLGPADLLRAFEALERKGQLESSRQDSVVLYRTKTRL